MTLLLVHTAATIAMFGVILVVQWVHYPLFRHVGAEGFAAYQAEHMRRITGIVGPLMGVELLTAGLLVVRPPPGVSVSAAGLGLVLVVLIWGTTGLVQVPLHRTLTDGFDASVHSRLVRTNWIRTVAWGLRTGLVLWMVARALQ